jgi:uracil-DNA glycosylase
MQSSLFGESAAPSRENVQDVNTELLEKAKIRFPGKIFVFGVGPEKSDVVVVGESPGPPDAASLKPFTGPAGDLLRKILKSIDINADDCYLTNAVKFISQGEEIDADTIAFFRPHLLREIFAVNPRIIISLGNTPTRSLLNTKESISKLRGKFADLDGIKVMPTFNPAYLLRDPTKKREAWDDMKIVRQFLA